MKDQPVNTSDEKPMTQVSPMSTGMMEGQQQSSLDKDIYRAETNLEQLNRYKELREAARPLMEYLRRHHCLTSVAVVSQTAVQINETLIMVQF